MHACAYELRAVFRTMSSIPIERCVPSSDGPYWTFHTNFICWDNVLLTQKQLQVAVQWCLLVCVQKCCNCIPRNAGNVHLYTPMGTTKLVATICSVIIAPGPVSVYLMSDYSIMWTNDILLLDTESQTSEWLF